MNPDLTLPYEGESPSFASRPVWCGRGSTVIGAARIGDQAWLGDAAVIRADGQRVTLGDRFWLGHRSTVHIATFTRGTTCGDRVTVGRNSVIHACAIGSESRLPDGAAPSGAPAGAGVRAFSISDRHAHDVLVGRQKLVPDLQGGFESDRRLRGRCC